MMVKIMSNSKRIKEKIHFYVSGLAGAVQFNMPFKNETYDIVFNSGVIEHFDKKERSRALKEYSRILRNDGVIIIAFPNHFSVPYSLAYLVRNNLLFRYRWPILENIKFSI